MMQDEQMNQSSADDPQRTGAEVLVEQLKARGVQRIFGVPGGDCSLDIIEAAKRAGIPFIVSRTENAAAMMAAAGAEVAGGLGVLLTTRGPGLANGANGVAYAWLDRSPLLVISDGYENEQAYVSHQRFDQAAMLAPVTKGSLRVDAPTALPAIGPLLDLALSEPAGPVYLEVTGRGMRTKVPAAAVPVHSVVAPLPEPSIASLEVARAAMAKARKPVIVAGLQARETEASRAVRELARRWNCPVLATYKAKGVLDDADPLMIGPYIVGVAEDALLAQADLVVWFGADPVEFAPTPFKHQVPSIEISTRAFPRNYITPLVHVQGNIVSALRQLETGLVPSAWEPSALRELKSAMRARAAANEGGPITPQMLTEAGCAVLPDNVRITVDAGAHMLPIMALFNAHAPRDVLISRGLASMAFALPSAVGAALADPSRPVVAFTGDGGLMMCMAELATAVQAGCKLTVVVFNDANMTLIDVKQRRRSLPKEGVSYSSADFAQMARGCGAQGWRVEAPDELEGALRAALACDGPALVDVVIDPRSYDAQVRALRG